MRLPFPSLRRVALVSVVTLSALTGTALPAPATATAPTPATATAAVVENGQAVCASPRPRPQPLARALKSGATPAGVRAQNDLTRTELNHLADDATTWLDECGAVFVVDHALPAAQQNAAPAVTPAAAAVPVNVFDLSSRPGANRTIYLDFDGATHTGTRWNAGQTVISPAYSIDADPTTFTDTERAQILLAWRSVAEDFAPFDVNVTTRQPASEDLTRTTSLDPTYGTTIVVTSTNAAGTGCGCGGIAYTGVFGNAAANDFHPAFVYTHGAGTNGYNLGQVIAHEAGHTIGLSHDATASSSYYSGANSWAPIMGSSYGKRVSHWSSGEYSAATNTEDDIAILSGIIPVLSDDHANTPAGATKLTAGTTTNGLITTRTDTDAFTFTSTGTTTVTVTGPQAVSNTDVRLSILDASGQPITSIDPVADPADDTSMSATWTTTLTGTTTLTALVDGVGYGNPATAGGYSDYGSLGAYTITLTTTAPLPPEPTTPGTPGTPGTPETPTQPDAPTGQPPTDTHTPTSTPGTPGTPGSGPTTSPTPVAFTTTRLPKARVGKKYRTEIRFTGAVSEARVNWRLPTGLRWTVRKDRILITGRIRQSGTSTFTAMLSSDGPTVRHTFRLKAR